MTTFLLHGMYKREDRVLQTLGLNHGAAVGLHSTLRETSPFSVSGVPDQLAFTD